MNAHLDPRRPPQQLGRARRRLAARLAASYYLGDEADVETTAQVFHGYLGNRDAYADFSWYAATEHQPGLQADPTAPVGINPPGAMKDGHNMDGFQPEQMRRCGDGTFKWPPCTTGYNRGGLQGAVMQAELLTRLGWPGVGVGVPGRCCAPSTGCTTTQPSPAAGTTPEGIMGWQPWLINYAYGTDFPAERAPQTGRTMGFTDWTHDGRTAR